MLEASIQELSSFVPQCIAEKLKKACLEGPLVCENIPHFLQSDSCPAAVLQVSLWQKDEKNSSKIRLNSESISHLNVDIEKINEIFEFIIDVIDWNQGSILKFTSGTFLVTWRTSTNEETLFSSIWRAVQCAQALANLKKPNFALSCSIGAGVLHSFWAGTFKYFYIHTGEPLSQIEFLEKARDDKTYLNPVLFSRQSWIYVGAYAKGTMVMGFDWELEEYLFELEELEREISQPVFCCSTNREPVMIKDSVGSRTLRAGQLHQLVGALSSIIPRATLAQLGNVPGSFRQSEFRRVTVVSILLPSLDEHAFLQAFDKGGYSICELHKKSSSYSDFPSEFSPLGSTEGPIGSIDYTEDVTHSFSRDEEVDMNFIEKSEGSLVEIQQVIDTTLRVLDHYGGHLYDISIGTKGTTLLLVFGLYPSHESDPSRAVSTCDVLKKNFGWDDVGIGIATGSVLCSIIGNKCRRAFSLFGSALYRAIHICSMEDTGKLLCDSTTYRLAHQIQEHVQEQHLDALLCVEETLHVSPIKIVSPSQPRIGGSSVDVYSSWGPLPRSFSSPKFARREILLKEDGPISGYYYYRDMTIGRDAEFTVLKDALIDFYLEQKSSLFIIEGFAGIGKTNLVRTFCECCKIETPVVQVFYSTGYSAEMYNPYFAWKGIFYQLYKVTEDDGISLADIVYSELQMERYEHLAPLLNNILDLCFPENHITLAMSPEARADKTRDLLLYLLQDPTETPRMFIIEDVHWFDSGSWTLLHSVARQIRPVLIVITTRKLYDHVTPEIEKLHRNASTLGDLSLRKIELDVLDAKTTIELAEHVLQREIPSQLYCVFEKSGGHPLLCEELARALNDSCSGSSLKSNTEELLSKIDASCSALQSVFQARMDHITPSQQLTLKIMSIFGNRVPLDDLLAVHPKIMNEEDLLAEISELVRQHFIKENDDINYSGLEKSPILINFEKQQTSKSPLPLNGTLGCNKEKSSEQVDLQRPKKTYHFVHDLIRQTAYDSMLPSQRRIFHEAVACYYEKMFMELGEEYSSGIKLCSLAVHWEMANATEKAIRYFEEAGDRAEKMFANREVIEIFEHIIELDKELLKDEKGSPFDSFKRASWQRKICEAAVDYGKIDLSIESSQHALSLLGENISKESSAASLMANITRTYFGKMVARRIWGSSSSASAGFDEGKKEGRAAEIARVLIARAIAWYYNGNDMESFYCTLRAFIVLDKCDEASSVRPLVWAGTAINLHGMGMSKLANFLMNNALSQVETTPLINVRLRVYLWGGFFRIMRGEWDLFREIERQAGILRVTFGFPRAEEEFKFLFGAAFNLIRGDIDEAENENKGIIETSMCRFDEQTYRWFLVFSALINHLRGKADHALKLLDDISLKNETTMGCAREYSLKKTVAVASYIQLKRYEKAHRIVSKLCHDEAERYLRVGHHMDIFAMILCCDSILHLLERAHKKGDTKLVKECNKNMEYALMRQSQLQKSAPIIKCCRMRFDAQRLALKGQYKPAIRLLRKSLAESKKYPMLIEVAKTHYILCKYGANGGLSEEERIMHYNEAKQIFERTGCVVKLKEVLPS